MSAILTREDLDASGCDDPGCTHDHSILYLHSQCHPDHGVTARYDKRQGLVIICCLGCHVEVVRIAPASRTGGRSTWPHAGKPQ